MRLNPVLIKNARARWLVYLVALADWSARDGMANNRGTREITDTLAGQLIMLRYDRLGRSLTATHEQGDALPMVTLYWFAWAAFHPDTDVWRAPQGALTKGH